MDGLVKLWHFWSLPKTATIAHSYMYLEQSWWLQHSSCSESHLAATQYAEVWNKKLASSFKRFYTFSCAALSCVTRSLWVLLQYSFGWLSEHEERHQNWSISIVQDWSSLWRRPEASHFQAFTSFYIGVYQAIHGHRVSCDWMPGNKATFSTLWFTVASFPGSPAPECEHWSCADEESLVFFSCEHRQR